MDFDAAMMTSKHSTCAKGGSCHQELHATGLLGRENDNAARWRPRFHLIAPRGFMNDPCAPAYIASRGLYHVGFQWNPNGAEWADIVWGSAFSRDLVLWEVSETPSLERDASYDHAGIFTGCMVPAARENVREEGEQHEMYTLFYTSVSRVPIHYAQEYHVGSETLSLATSRDGETWEKAPQNPILPGPPEELGATITGWRDPFVSPWTSMESIVSEIPGQGAANDCLFGIISGGIRDLTPTTWLYKIDPRDLTKWQYVSPLIMPGLNFSPSRWSGDLGVNWEVTNFLSLRDERNGGSQDFLILGAEGCKPPHGGPGTAPGTSRFNRAVLWVAIDATGEGPAHNALMSFSYGGIFDHGLLYAANGFWDPVSKKQIVIGWITEEDLPVEMQVKQGWSGCLSLPRNVSLATIPHVCRTTKSALKDITSIRASPETEYGDLHTVQMLSISPDGRLERLRDRALRQQCEVGPVGAEERSRHIPLSTPEWEAVANFSNIGSCQRVGLIIHHASTSQRTTLYFTPAEETIYVDRPSLCTSAKSSCGTETESRPAALQQELAPFTLFTTRDPQTGIEAEEQLRIHLYYDMSVLEIFVNDRAVITTRIYLDTAVCTAVELFAESESVVLGSAVIWDGLRCDSRGETRTE